MNITFIGYGNAAFLLARLFHGTLHRATGWQVKNRLPPECRCFKTRYGPAARVLQDAHEPREDDEVGVAGDDRGDVDERGIAHRGSQCGARAFTLIELLVVIAIIAILAAITAPTSTVSPTATPSSANTNVPAMKPHCTAALKGPMSLAAQPTDWLGVNYYTRGVMKHDPANPKWPDRDRFVLSNGHASMLLYALLHLTGYERFPIEQILLLELDLREMLLPHLNLDPARRTGCVPAAIVIQTKSQFLGGIKQ